MTDDGQWTLEDEEWAIRHSRLHGEPTSYEAAKEIAAHAKVQVEAIVLALRECGPMTCDQIDVMCRWRPTTAGRRIADAQRLELVEFTGEKRFTRSGRRANVYRVKVNREENAA